MKLLEVYKKIERETKFIKEDIGSGTLISVDIQPEYQRGFTFNINDWVDFINNLDNSREIVFLYNGADTLGMISEGEYIDWLYNLGIEEDVINRIIYYDKGYAFFRYCIDMGAQDENIVEMIRFMVKHNINDSREINDDIWEQFMEETNNTESEVMELLQYSDDMINIPDLMDFLQEFENVTLIGGGIHECLKEVELALLAMNKKFNFYKQFIY